MQVVLDELRLDRFRLLQRDYLNYNCRRMTQEIFSFPSAPKTDAIGGDAAGAIQILDQARPGMVLPAIFSQDSPAMIARALEYFRVAIPNESTRANYQRAAVAFCTWITARGATSLRDVQPIHVAEFIAERRQHVANPTVIGELAALRGWFTYLTMGGFLPNNPASDVKGPRHTRTEGKTAGLSSEEASRLLGSIEGETLKGKRDRAIIGLMLYSACRVGAVGVMKVEDFYQAGTLFYINLHEKGGKDRTLPVHHKAAEYVHAWIQAAGIGAQPKSPLFRTMPKRVSLQDQPFTDHPMVTQSMAKMVKLRCEKAGLGRRFSNHSFRVTAITNLLENGVPLDQAQVLAGHADARTTKLYDRRSRGVTPALIEQINYERSIMPQI
jgi:site-specific recombinase XerD